MRGVSLEEIAATTKIGTRLLKALEDEQFDLLPGGIFNKGFVRAYAKYLGMDEDQAVSEYMHAAGNAEPDVQLIAHQSERVEPRYSDSGRSQSGFPLLPVLILFVVAAGGFGGWRLYQQHMQERAVWRAEREAATSGPESNPAPTATSQPAEPAPSQATPAAGPPNASPPATETTSTPVASSVVGSPSGASTSTASPADASGFEVVVKTTGRAWLSLKADGKYVVKGVLDADQVRTLRANQEIVVWTGNAGATEILFQGKPVPVEGGINDARVLVFKPDGLQPQRAPSQPKPVESPAQPPAEPSPTPQ